MVNNHPLPLLKKNFFLYSTPHPIFLHEKAVPFFIEKYFHKEIPASSTHN